VNASHQQDRGGVKPVSPLTRLYLIPVHAWQRGYIVSKQVVPLPTPSQSTPLSHPATSHPGTYQTGTDQTGHPSTADQSGDASREVTEGNREILLGWTLYVKYLNGLFNEHDWDLICVKIGADHDSHHGNDDGNGIDMKEKFDDEKNISGVMTNKVFIHFSIIF
jgi:hypothetical protein